MTTKKTNIKSTKKIYKWNTPLVERLALKYGVSCTLVRWSLSGERESSTSITIKKEYKTVQKDIDSILDKVHIIHKQA